MSTEHRVKEIIAQHLSYIGNQRQADNLKAEQHLANDLGADSLDHVELLIEMEDEFDIVISDEEASGLNTVGDFVAVVASKAKVAEQN